MKVHVVVSYLETEDTCYEVAAYTDVLEANKHCDAAQEEQD